MTTVSLSQTVFTIITNSSTTSRPHDQCVTSRDDRAFLDATLRSMLAPVSQALNLSEISTGEAAGSFHYIMIELQSQLNPTRASSIQLHRERAILRVCKSLAKSKNRIREGPAWFLGSNEFLAAVRAHNKATRNTRSLKNTQSTRRQEHAFRKKP